MTQMTTRVPPQITLDKRIEWARVALEEACDRLAADRFRSPAYVAAVIGRARELSVLRSLTVGR